MKHHIDHPIDSPEVRSYLAALEARLAHLPTDQSAEIMFGVREHIAEALERGGKSLSEVLASLGRPDDVLAGLPGSDTTALPAMQQPVPQQQPRPPYQSSTFWLVATAILLPFGIFLAGVGYLFGLAGLWMGTRWKLWEKIAGTLLFPGGVLGAMYLSLLPVWNTPVDTRSGAPEVSLQDVMLPGMSLGASVVTAFIPVIVAVYLLVVGVRRGDTQP